MIINSLLYEKKFTHISVWYLNFIYFFAYIFILPVPISFFQTLQLGKAQIKKLH